MHSLGAAEPTHWVTQADAAGDANARIAALERLHAALLARDEVSGRIAVLDEVHVRQDRTAPGSQLRHLGLSSPRK